MDKKITVKLNKALQIIISTNMYDIFDAYKLEKHMNKVGLKMNPAWKKQWIKKSQPKS